ncbi:MAG: lytic transglycosylase domain-containing protein [Atopobiaceae bacterium]|nr:lytic transglycosylase domain-containing protein [Atopobiaceae bacterium]
MVMLLLGLASFAVSAFPQMFGQMVLAPVSYTDDLLASCERHGVDPYLACAVIKCESGWDASIESSAGAVGLMQLMPDTALEVADMGLVDRSIYDPTNLTDPATNIEYGCAYLGYLIRYFGNEEVAVAAYNAGMGWVEQWTAPGYESFDDVIEFPETASYLVRVRAVEEEYRLCWPNGIGA